MPVWAWVASRFLRAGGYWRVVGEGVFPSPPFFVAAGVPLGCGESKGGGVG